MLLMAGLVSHANRYHSDSNNSGQTGTPELQKPPLFAGPGGRTEQPSPEDRQEAREEADVAAQLRMAAAAENAVYISFLALFGLLATVYYAWRAWRAAQKSADADEAALVQARLATVAAFKAEQTTREIGQKQSRAYLIVTGARLEEWPFFNAFSKDGPDHAFQIDIRNIGQTIAKKVTIKFCIKVGEKRETFSVREIVDPASQDISNIVPGQESPFWIYSLLKKWKQQTEAHNASLTVLEPKWHIHFWGEVHYTDVFGRRHRTGFQYVTPDRDIEKFALVNVTLDLPICEELEEDEK